MKGFLNSQNDKNKKISDRKFTLRLNDMKLKALKYQNSGNLTKASEIYEKLIRYKIQDYKVYLNYGILCQFLKKYDSALELFNKSLNLNPNNYLANFKIAFILNELGRYSFSLNYAQKSLLLEPNKWQIYMLNIQIYENLNQTKEALNIANNANIKSPNNHNILTKLANLHAVLGDHESADQYFLESLKLEPINTDTLYSYSTFLLSLGNTNKSKELLIEIINIDRNYSIAYFSLSRILKLKDNYYAKKILNFDIEIFNDNYNKYNLLFAKSNIYHRQSEFEKSKEYLIKANNLKLIDKPDNSDKLINLSKLLSESKLEKSSYFVCNNNTETQNIFIVGLPRSGSTLVESILGMNENVFNLGENSIFYNSYNESKINNLKDLSRLYSSKVSLISNRKIATNKTLINYIYTPFILDNICNSKVVFTYRNPLDNILSLYRSKFTGKGNEYSSCIISSAKVLLNHVILMYKYKEIFKNNLYFLNYDLLVNKPNEQIEKLIKWFNWDWDDKYLSPELSKQAFYTASIVQVRSPINNKSVNGWKNYESLLKPAMDFIYENNSKLPNQFKKEFTI